MNFSTFTDNSEFCSELYNTANKLQNLLKDNNSTILDNNLIPVSSNSYHFLSTILYPHNRYEKTLYATIFDTLRKAELTSANSSEICIKFSIELIKNFFSSIKIKQQNYTELLQKVENYFSQINKIIYELSDLTTEEVLFDEIKTLCNSDILANVSKEAIVLSGLEGKCYITEGKGNSYVVELKHGYSFKLGTYDFFLKNSCWEQNEVKILIVDGIVEKISELDNVLNKSLATKMPMVIIARGYNEEVIATLKINATHGLLNILPLTINSDLESINLINDISVVCGANIVSTLKGDMVQFANYDLLPTVEKIKYTSKETVIENSATQNNVNQHIKTLLKKRLDNILIPDVCTLIDDRIKSLFAHTVNIQLPSMSSIESEAIKTKFDICFRTCKTLLNYGVIDFNKFVGTLEQHSSCDEIEHVLTKTMKELKLNKSKISALSLYIGTYLSAKAMIALMHSNGFVQLVK